MNEELKHNLIVHKITTAKNMLSEIRSHIELGYYNTAMNRMYYACFYSAAALLIDADVTDVKRHATVRNLFNQLYIKEGIFDKKWGTFYSDVMDCRAAADYEEFKFFTLEEVQEMFPLVEEFVMMVYNKFNKSSTRS